MKQILNKRIVVPKVFHEILGTQTTLLEITLILVPSLLIIVMLFYTNWNNISSLPWISLVIIFILAFDLAAGVIANFTYGTNKYYSARPKFRKFFIAIHVQPLVFSWLTGHYWTEGLVVWLYTVIMAFVIDSLSGHPSQRPLAAAALTVGIATLVFFASLPTYFMLILALYMIKLILSFPVNHYCSKE